jgi:hypothetical protein
MRRNLKIRQGQKAHFTEPYDVYFTYLLCVGLHSDSNNLLPSLNVNSDYSNQKWTIWISTDQYQQMNLLKNSFGVSNIPHFIFVDTLIQLQAYLLRLKMIPTFAAFRISQKRCINNLIQKSLQFNDLFEPELPLDAPKVQLRKKRHNVKFPLAFRDLFPCSFEKAIEKLLCECQTWSKIPFTEDILSKFLQECPKGSDWTVWMSEEQYRVFIDSKAKFCPGLLHCEFMYLLLQLIIK